MRAWYQRKSPEERRAWVALRDPERVLAHERARGRTPEKQAAIERSKTRHPERDLARRMVGIRVRHGTIQKQPCHCGATKVEAHHPDYSKPLEVEWLCRKHHVERHPRALMQRLAA